jgi:glycosyltransferase involved in cell wall biosynthesis
MERVMQNGKRIVVVLPAYNAERTLARTLAGVPEGIVDQFLLVDDASRDHAAALAQVLSGRYPLSVITHAKNRGYGANQKTCYERSLQAGADVTVMLHPDYQYGPF